MKRIKNILLAVLPLSVMLLSGCQEKDIELYQDYPFVYFDYDDNGMGTRQRDYISQSFFGKRLTVKHDTLTVYVNMSGLKHDYDRPVKLRQVNAGEENAAIEGVHFVPFDNEYVQNSMVVKANATRAEVKIVVIKYEDYDDPQNSLELNVKELKLELVENEYFHPGLSEERQNFLITMTSIAAKPTNWDTVWKDYFGATWGTVKFGFIIDATGYTDWEVKPDINFSMFMRDAVAKAFYDYNLEHPNDPLKEANGDIVVFL